MATTRKPKPPEADEATLRRILQDDPATKGIAKNLGIPLDEYIDQVIHFVNNPEAEPDLYVVPDDELRKMGMEPPDQQAIAEAVMQDAKIAVATAGTEYDAHKKPMVDLAEPIPTETRARRPDLEAELQAELKKGRGKH